MSFCPPKDVILVQDKSANGRAKGNVLIDDWKGFLDRWTEKGGLSIEYKANFIDSDEEVKNYLEQKLKLQ